VSAGIRSRVILEELLCLKCEVWFWSLSQREKSTYISYLHLHSAWSKVFANASYFICRARPLQSFKFYICLDVNLNIKYYLCISHNIQNCFKYWKPRCVMTISWYHRLYVCYTTMAHSEGTNQFLDATKKLGARWRIVARRVALLVRLMLTVSSKCAHLPSLAMYRVILALLSRPSEMLFLFLWCRAVAAYHDAIGQLQLPAVNSVEWCLILEVATILQCYIEGGYRSMIRQLRLRSKLHNHMNWSRVIQARLLILCSPSSLLYWIMNSALSSRHSKEGALAWYALPG